MYVCNKFYNKNFPSIEIMQTFLKYLQESLDFSWKLRLVTEFNK